MKVLTVLAIFSLSVWSMDLDDAIEQALNSSPQIKQSMARHTLAQTREMGAQAGFHPKLDVGFQWQDQDKTTTFGFSPTHRYFANASYNLFRGFADKAIVEAASLNSDAEAYLLEAAKADVTLDVITAYAACLKADAMVQTQKEASESLERAYRDMQIKYDQGVVAKDELLLIDVDRLRARQALLEARATVETTYSNLSQLIGRVVSPSEELAELKRDLLEPEPFDDALEHALANRHELLALQKTQSASQAQYQAASGGYYPNVDLGLNYTIFDKERYSSSNANVLVQVDKQLSTTVNVSWNLYNGRADEAQREGLLQELTIVNQEIEAMKRSLRHQLLSAYQVYDVAKQALEVAKLAVKSAEENLRITRDRHEYGESDTLTLLKAQANQTAAKNSYTSAYYDIFTAQRTIGRIAAY